MTVAIATLHEQVSAWLKASRQRIYRELQAPLTVATKSGRTDLVTNVDRANQRFLISQIHAAYPQAHIEGEEGRQAKLDRLAGLVFFVDPIDGTMNFVKQRANFAVMIGVYIDGAPLYGAILDVARDELITGGPNWPLQLNDRPLPTPADLALADGLIGVNGHMLIRNGVHVADVALKSAGPRLIGSAGMEFIAVALGQQVGYVSYLQPWDVAPGLAIGANFGLQVTRPDASAIDLLEPGIVVAAMPKAHAEIIDLMQG
ncbi:inositol monophosphatase family protein [Lacticaseibacillus baoqingensis]|uniref:Inositol monophosphatase family protein n=1 Tax=Lacticaseibacillus baoqingensis TaxID=2486013 RepID=A0ABW4E6W2_9LACO|nr:inositol monophosphatase family protein [Lacticaseibacillus baoqingensis]